MNLNTTLSYGLIAGIVTVVYFLNFYLVNPRLMLNTWVMWGSLAIYIAAMIMACRRQREAQQYQLSFGAALSTAFPVYAMASIVYYSFYYILFNFIDPDLVEVQRELVLENLDKVAGLVGDTDEEELRRQYEQEDFKVTLANTGFGFAQSLIGGFILSLGVAGVMKKP